ncbi:MAG TPA: hypothetical protein VG733_10440 [Chthoniobacteraceae bacterium]|nr:hypothetical protein [Chthoniobacteraceae bacterium]
MRRISTGWLAALAVFAAWTGALADPAASATSEVAAAKAKATQAASDSKIAAQASKFADAKAASLEAARAKAEAAVATAARELEQAKASGDAKAAADAKAAMDAEIDALSQATAQAKAAAQAAADAKKIADEKAAAAYNYTQAAEDAADEVKAIANARKWLPESLAHSRKGHFTAVVEVATEAGKPLAAFRYDRFPGVERMLADDDALFARRAGVKKWRESADWGKTGAPADAKRSAELDAMVELALRALQPPVRDPREGDVKWRRLPSPNPPPIPPGLAGIVPPMLDDYTFEQGRENPAPPGERAPYPFFHFGSTDDTVSDEPALDTMIAHWKWYGADAKVTVNYFYFATDTAPPARPLPEESALSAFRAMESAPVKVEVTVTPNGAPRLRIAGIISGKDFDLTVMQGDRAPSRQLAVGGDFWTSADAGATWHKEDAADRTYYNLILHRVPGFFPERPLLWPFWINGNTVDKGTASKKLSAMETELGHPGQEATYDVEMMGGKPVLLRIFTMDQTGGPLSGNLYASFHDPAGARGVLPPPGNPDAVPGDSANEVLVKAVKAMSSGVWRVDFSARRQIEGGWQKWRDTGQVRQISGLVSGDDFDLATTQPGGKPALERRIGIDGKVWARTGKDGAWKPCESVPGVAAPYDEVRLPLGEDYTGWVYDIAGKETHGGETWLHIRCQGGVTLGLAAGPEYWVLLDKEGKPACIRRCTWAPDVYVKGRGAGESSLRDYDEVDFTSAGEEEKIAAPK